ncbi:MAG: Rrf2 family transcriptional regulator [Ignavibacteriota bacterium]
MNISVKGEYALQAIFDLATQRPGEPVRIGDIARRQSIPQKFLELILAGLKQGGFVESRRAPKADPPGACGGLDHGGRSAAICRGAAARQTSSAAQGRHTFQRYVGQVDAAISGIIDKTTFADLLRSWTDKQNRFVLNWEI